MADFATWQHETLAKFAAEASAKLLVQVRQISHLELQVKNLREHYAAALGKLRGFAWTETASQLPDDDVCVIIELDDGEVWTGYLDAGVWHDVSATRIDAGRVVRWMQMPEGGNDQAKGREHSERPA